MRNYLNPDGRREARIPNDEAALEYVKSVKCGWEHVINAKSIAA